MQGRIALKHVCDQFYTHVDIVGAAPFNVGREGKYKGVGAHLFAIACNLAGMQEMRDMYNLLQKQIWWNIIKRSCMQ